MSEIVITIAVSALVLYAVIIAAAWAVHGRRLGLRERALFARWGVLGMLVMAAVCLWTTAGIFAFLVGTEFWRGAWVGGSVVLWLGYVPAFVCAARIGHRQAVAVRAADGKAGKSLPAAGPMVFPFCLLAGVFTLPGTASAQPPPEEYAREYRQTFRGPPEDPNDFFVIGPNAEVCVKYEPESLRIKLPTGHPSGTDTGLITRFGVEGDFEITLKYEVLQEPAPDDMGRQTRFSLYVGLDNRKQSRASVNRRWASGPPQLLTWVSVPGLKPGKPQTSAHTFPAQAKTGKLRLVRRGTELFYFAAEGNDANFKLLQKHAFGADNLRNVRIAAGTGGPKAAVEVRVTDFVIRAASFPRRPTRAMIAAKEMKPPQKQTRVTYQEPFKGQPQRPEDFILIGANADKDVKFEPDGLRITLPPGKRSWQATGVATAFGATGDFDISVRYEILAEPEPADAGAPNIGTRISLTANLGGVEINDASIRRKVPPFAPVHIMTYTSAEKLGTPFPVKEKTGRFRLVRTGDQIAYYLSEGLDKEFKLLTTHPFDPDDLRDIRILGQTSGPKAALDVRFSDLRISAASLPRRRTPPRSEKPPTIPEDFRSNAAAKPGTPSADAPAQSQPRTAPPRESGNFWLIAVPIVIGLLAVLALAAWFLLRGRGGTVQQSPALVSFACPHCERTLKAKGELAGKKVKCTQCGKTVFVPVP